MSESVLDHALMYYHRGMSVIPLIADGSKKPLMAWGQFAKQRPTEDQVHQWFHNNDRGIAIICGGISAPEGYGLEVLDFDDGGLFLPWFNMVKSIARNLTVVKTPSSGYHVLYYCSEWSGSHKIAMRPKDDFKYETLIETRGENAYIATVGSATGTHNQGDYAYVDERFPDLMNIKTITPEQRLRLWQAARAADESGMISKLIESAMQRAINDERRMREGRTLSNHFDKTFSTKYTWHEILGPHGWTSDDGIEWTRPGKEEGISARVTTADDGEQILTVFSTNAGELSPHAYDGTLQKMNLFRCFVLLNFDGHYLRAIKHVKKNGIKLDGISTLPG